MTARFFHPVHFGHARWFCGHGWFGNNLFCFGHAGFGSGVFLAILLVIALGFIVGWLVGKDK